MQEKYEHQHHDHMHLLKKKLDLYLVWIKSYFWWHKKSWAYIESWPPSYWENKYSPDKRVVKIRSKLWIFCVIKNNFWSRNDRGLIFLKRCKWWWSWCTFNRNIIDWFFHLQKYVWVKKSLKFRGQNFGKKMRHQN